jgi:hypothetical protein
MPAKDAVALLNAEHLFKKDETPGLEKADIAWRVPLNLRLSR